MSISSWKDQGNNMTQNTPAEKLHTDLVKTRNRIIESLILAKETDDCVISDLMVSLCGISVRIYTLEKEENFFPQNLDIGG